LAINEFELQISFSYQAVHCSTATVRLCIKVFFKIEQNGCTGFKG